MIPLGFPGAQGTAGAVPDDSALKELQSIKESYVSGPGNHRYRFKYLFLNVVENPAGRVKPADVDELQWREALRRAGGPDNPDHLWPVQCHGFKGLLERKAAQDEAIKEHSQRLQSLQEALASLAARQEAVLRTQLEVVRREHVKLSQQLLRILRYVSFYKSENNASKKSIFDPALRYTNNFRYILDGRIFPYYCCLLIDLFKYIINNYFFNVFL